MPTDLQRPVIIGIGECADRPANLGDALDPAGLMVAALQAAKRDAGIMAIATIDRLDIINEISWPYRDPCTVVAERLERTSIDVRYHPVGGQTPTLLLHEAALAIQRGEIEMAAICGGESADSVRRSRRDGFDLPWPAPVADFKPIRGGDYQSPVAQALELTSPVNVYPLYENATRDRWGLSLAQGQDETALIWANNAAVARSREVAWIRRPIEPEDVVSGAGGNRLIAWPYRKLMVANPIVNQGAAVILTSLGKALELGMPPERLIHVHGGAAADEPRDILKRPRYDESRAMEAVLNEASGNVPDAFDYVELYSCFPCVPKMARRTLGLTADTALTVCGGLTFFGAPLNNYMTHAIVAMVETLRVSGGTGLLYGQGEYVTKHHALVLASTPSVAALPDDFRLVEVEREIEAGAPVLSPDYRGPAIVETYTLLFDRDETVRHGIVIARNPAGERIAAHVIRRDMPTVTLLQGDGVIGAQGEVIDGAGGAARWTCS